MAHSAEGATSVSLSQNPVELVSGTDVTVFTKTFSMDSGFSSAHPEQIDNGTILIQLATDGLGGLTSSASAASWLSINTPGIAPSSGNVAVPLDLNSLGLIPGGVVGIRAMYISGNGEDSVKSHFSPALDLSALQVPCESTGLLLAAELVAGNGNPPPGFSTENGANPFVFAIKVKNCTGVDLGGVKVQGGTSGWTALVAATPTTGTVSIRENKRNQVITWNVDLPQSGGQTLVVILDGFIPEYADCAADANSPDSESVRYLSGEWSATYNPGTGPVKTDYTGRVSVVVTCP